MRIKAEVDNFGNLRVKAVEDEEKILEELVKRGVHEALVKDLLEAWIDRLQGDATAYQLELLERFKEAVDFLESVTVTE